MQMSFLGEVRSLASDILWFLHSMVVYCIRAPRKRLCVRLYGKEIVECKWKRGFALNLGSLCRTSGTKTARPSRDRAIHRNLADVRDPLGVHGGELAPVMSPDRRPSGSRSRTHRFLGEKAA